MWEFWICPSHLVLCSSCVASTVLSGHAKGLLFDHSLFNTSFLDELRHLLADLRCSLSALTSPWVRGHSCSIPACSCRCWSVLETPLTLERTGWCHIFVLGYVFRHRPSRVNSLSRLLWCIEFFLTLFIIIVNTTWYSPSWVTCSVKGLILGLVFNRFWGLAPSRDSFDLVLLG